MVPAKTVAPEGVVNVRFGSKADICSAKRYVRFAPENGHVQVILAKGVAGELFRYSPRQLQFACGSDPAQTNGLPMTDCRVDVPRRSFPPTAKALFFDQKRFA